MKLVILFSKVSLKKHQVPRGRMSEKMEIFNSLRGARVHFNICPNVPHQKSRWRCLTAEILWKTMTKWSERPLFFLWFSCWFLCSSVRKFFWFSSTIWARFLSLKLSSLQNYDASFQYFFRFGKSCKKAFFPLFFFVVWRFCVSFSFAPTWLNTGNSLRTCVPTVVLSFTILAYVIRE